jgi:hypothetical protein
MTAAAASAEAGDWCSGQVQLTGIEAVSFNPNQRPAYASS